MHFYFKISDQELIAKYKNGVAEAAEELTRRYYPKVVNLCGQYMRSVHDSQDVAQEVFLKVMGNKKIFGFRGEAQLWSWLYRITVNACQAELNKKKPAHYQFDSDYPPAGKPVRHGFSWLLNPEELVLHNEKIQRLQSAFGQLPPKYQKVIYSKYFEDRSYIETARCLKKTLSTMGIQLMRGKKMLAQLYRAEFRKYKKAMSNIPRGERGEKRSLYAWNREPGNN